MTIIITGVLGHIGSCFANYLQDTNPGETIIGVDWYGGGDKWKNIRSCKNIIDIISPDDKHLNIIDLIKQTKKCAVVHCGAISSTTATNMDEIFNTNVVLTKQMIRACVETGNRLVYISSAATYGESDDFSDAHDKLAELVPLNKYAYSKWFLDIWALRHRAFEAGIVGLKVFNSFGPNEAGHKGNQCSLISKIVKQYAESGETRVNLFDEKIVPSGTSSRDFVYVKDIAEVLTFFLDDGVKAQGIFNIGTGESRCWNDLVRSIEMAAGVPFSVSYVEMPKELKEFYQYKTQAEISKLRGVGYSQPFMTLEEAVQEYYQNHWNNGLEGYWK